MFEGMGPVVQAISSTILRDPTLGVPVTVAGAQSQSQSHSQSLQGPLGVN